MRRLASLLLLLPLLAACGGLSGTNDGGYISGNGQVVQYAADQRGDAVTFSGTLLDGTAFDPASVAGKVTVVNIWGAWCGECLKEAPLVQGAHEKLGDEVAFLGVDIRDTSEATSLAFERSHQITYLRPAFAGDQLEFVTHGAHHDRLQQALGADAFHEFRQRLVGKFLARLIRIGLDLMHWHLAVTGQAVAARSGDGRRRGGGRCGRRRLGGGGAARDQGTEPAAET